MSPFGDASPSEGALELPPFSLDIESLDLGSDVKAVGLELVETENHEPLRGKQAAEIWAAAFPSLTNDEFFVVDFFSHLDRVREFCTAKRIEFREAAGRCLVLPRPSSAHLQELFERFEGETFGVRAGAAAQAPDPALENDLSKRGVDAYQPAYERYTFCAVCEPRDGWVTLLSATLWPTEVVRRLRPALQPFDLYISRPQ